MPLVGVSDHFTVNFVEVLHLFFTLDGFIFSPLVSKLIPGSIPKVSYRLKFTKGTGKTKVISIDYSFTSYDIICLALCSLLGLWYLLKKVHFPYFI